MGPVFNPHFWTGFRCWVGNESIQLVDNFYTYLHDLAKKIEHFHCVFIIILTIQSAI